MARKKQKKYRHRPRQQRARETFGNEIPSSDVGHGVTQKMAHLTDQFLLEQFKLMSKSPDLKDYRTDVMVQLMYDGLIRGGLTFMAAALVADMAELTPEGRDNLEYVTPEERLEIFESIGQDIQQHVLDTFCKLSDALGLGGLVGETRMV